MVSAVSSYLIFSNYAPEMLAYHDPPTLSIVRSSFPPPILSSFLTPLPTQNPLPLSIAEFNSTIESENTGRWYCRARELDYVLLPHIFIFIP